MSSNQNYRIEIIDTSKFWSGMIIDLRLLALSISSYPCFDGSWMAKNIMICRLKTIIPGCCEIHNIDFGCDNNEIRLAQVWDKLGKSRWGRLRNVATEKQTICSENGWKRSMGADCRCEQVIKWFEL